MSTKNRLTKLERQRRRRSAPDYENMSDAEREARVQAIMSELGYTEPYTSADLDAAIERVKREQHQK